MVFSNSQEFARQMDAKDPLAKFRTRFYMPRKNQREALYFCGNSLGLQPRDTFSNLEQELFDWAAMGVEGHFHAKNPWVSYHEKLTDSLATLTGSQKNEVVAMNSLTTNLHLLLVSFYRPDKKRYKILCEHKPFPSDRFAIESQIRFHGLNPDEVLIEMVPRDGEYCLRTEDILSVIAKNKSSLSLVLMGGVNYFTGQVFDMKAISAAAHKAGALVGFDLAHAIGNVKLELHYWEVDFACWCSYKYLNSGPGGVGGAFVHEKHLKDSSIPRFNGWWGNRNDKKFLMDKEFSPPESAEAWQLSNAPVLSMAAQCASLNLFQEAGFDALLLKSKHLTAYLDFIIRDLDQQLFDGNKTLEIITPENEAERGCQLSIIVHEYGKEIYDLLQRNGVISDWREPSVIRLAPVPLYNSFEDIFLFGQVFESVLKKTVHEKK